MSNRIEYALYLDDWSFNGGDKRQLRENAKTVLVNEYTPQMKGHLYCSEYVFRSLEGKDYAANGRRAYFAHSRGIVTDCGLRTKRAEGKKYLTEEEAKKAFPRQ